MLSNETEGRAAGGRLESALISLLQLIGGGGMGWDGVTMSSHDI